MATAVTQAQDGFDTLSSYFDDLSQYYTDGTGQPDQLDLLALNFDEILSFVTENSARSADFSIGAGIESIHHFLAVDREIGMGTLGKTSIYLSAVSEFDEEGGFHDQNAAFFSGVLKGAPTTGSQC